MGYASMVSMFSATAGDYSIGKRSPSLDTQQPVDKTPLNSIKHSQLPLSRSSFKLPSNMKINTFSVLAAVLALVSIAQAASTPGGETRPIPFTAVNTNNSSDTISGDASPQSKLPEGETSTKDAGDFACWDEVTSGASYAISCTGPRWFVHVTCSNNRLYVTEEFSGSYRVTVTCPSPYYAKKGGALPTA
ncbi:hypothetical protein B0O80DRAFT_426848 [Mortierella sp. GBAus27b]|nr:hypothetical protein B0O80DRAFT_426848 [Mortierella sp. GBAus27b]